MIVCKELNDEVFDSKDALFLALKTNKEEIFKVKKSNIKTDFQLELKSIKKTDASNLFDIEEGYFYAVINATNVLDSHNDVHLDTIWNKTIKESKGKIPYCLEHNRKLDGQIVQDEDIVDIFTHKCSFREAGFDLEGDTTLLVFKMRESDIINPTGRNIISKRKPSENSAGMIYQKMILCINSEAEQFKEEKQNWDKTISKVSNKESALENGYFLAHSEARLIEGSMTYKGSCPVTSTFYPSNEKLKSIEPSQDTQNEPSKDTQNQIDYKSITQNFKLN